MPVTPKMFLLVTTLIGLFGHSTEKKMICNDTIDLDELKSKIFCDNYISKYFVDAYNTLQKTNKYIYLKIKSSLISIEENCKDEDTKKRSPETCKEQKIFKSCDEAIKNGPNGFYLIKSLSPRLSEPFMVYCARDEKGQAWSVIQRRRNRDGSIFNFPLTWADYKKGFGDFLIEFWLGLDKINALIYRNLGELWITFINNDNEYFTAKYGTFGIGTEKEYYTLQVLGNFTGNATDELRSHSGLRFSTKDKLNENNLNQNSIVGWWISENTTCNLNAPFGSSKLCWKNIGPISYIRIAIREIPFKRILL